MKKILIFPALIVFFSLLFSCNDLFDDGLDSFPDTDFGAAMLYPSGNTKTDKIQRYIFAHHPATRAEGPVSLTPYLRGEDTVLLIANYGTGWDIFGYDERGPMVIASSESGEFLLTDTANYPSNFVGYIDATADQLHELMAEASDSVQPYGLWNLYVHFEPGKNDSLKVDDPRDTTRTKEELGKVIAQKEIELLNDIIWHQGDPWNKYIIIDDSAKTAIDSFFNYYLEDTHYPEDTFLINWAYHYRNVGYIANRCPVGCGALALGMFLYCYHHEIASHPIRVPERAEFDTLNNVMNFYGETTSIWNHMNALDSATIDSIAVFLGSISKEVCHKFRVYETRGIYTKYLDFLNSNNLSHTFDMDTFSFDNVRMIIDMKLPVLGRLKNEAQKTAGHQFLYRGYKQVEEIRFSNYVSNKVAMKWGWTDTEKKWDDVWFDASDDAEWHWGDNDHMSKKEKFYFKMIPR